jgi:tRNA modification GTPase
VSGPGAIEVAGVLLREPSWLGALPDRRVARAALIAEDGAPLDEALCVVMRAPHSYTGEDVVELSCHGSPALLRAILTRLTSAGARLAEPGEFTRRAFLNGRMDLARAEAVALLIGARTERAARLAARALSSLGNNIDKLRDEMVDVMAGLEVRLDFPEESVGLSEADAAAVLRRLGHTVDAWRRAGDHGRLVHEGLTIAIVGAPNAGKSTLMNALVGQERAIVAPTPGTTRDIVESTIAIAGVPVRMLDTAGLGEPENAIDAEGMRRARKAIGEADVLVVVVDGSAPPDDAMTLETAGKDCVIVYSKADLPRHPAASKPERNALAVSAMDGTGLSSLKHALVDVVAARVGGDGDEGELVVSIRQRELLVALSHALHRATDGLVAAPLEASLVDLREALTLASELLGVGVGDVVLDRVFASFCLGK